MKKIPAWTQRFLDIYKAGVAHAFILHFNTGDYVTPESPVTLTAYLAQLFASRDIAAIYSRDKGITFPVESMRQDALDILGIAQQQGQSGNATLEALQSLGMVSGGGSGGQELPRTPAEALPLLDRLLRETEKNTAVIIEDAEYIIPDASLAMMNADDRTALATIARWGSDPEIVNAGNPVILITGNLGDLHQSLRAASNRYESLEIPLPDTETRRRFIERYLDERPVPLAEGLTVTAIANATAGLNLLHVEDILLRAEAVKALTQALVWERKQQIIKTEFGDVLEVIEPQYGFDDIGGLAHVKAFFKRSIIRPISEGRKKRVPMGVLMTGPAGTGKSIMAVAIAREAGVNAVNLRIGDQIASKWQGEGERNLDRALRAIAGLAPTIVFIDEIDQAIQRGGEGGGNQQEKRIFQRLLEFMSDTSHRGEVVFLAATNRPDLMDAALRRPGRFDKKIPFLVPDKDEREAIFKVMARRYLGIEALKISNEALDATEGWTGAEIEAAAVKAAELIEDENLAAEAAILAACKRLSPSTADIELMTMLAIRETNDSDLLPPKYRELLADRSALDARVQQAQGSVKRQRREL